MTFNLVYTKRAIRDVRNLEPSVRLRIGKTLLRIREDPLKYAERMTDAKLGSHRLHIGDYRLVFDLEHDLNAFNGYNNFQD